jgi:hypothetical protein
MNAGRGNDTYFNGEFVWAVLGSQVRLVLVGSKLHGELLESVVRREKKIFPDSELEVGGIYTNRQGDDFVLIGMGTKKVNKYLIQRLHTRGTPQQQVDENIIALRDFNNPNWHHTSSFKVVYKLGQVNLPIGTMPAFDKRIELLRRR